MEISKITGYSTPFRGFYTDRNGAYELAEVFKDNPELEQKFMDNIVAPLENTQRYDVYLEGHNAGILRDGKGVMSVIQPGSKYNHTLGVVADYEMHCRNGLRRNSYLEPTENFRDDGYLLHHLEVAKNIVLDREYTAKTAAAKNYAKYASESVHEKADRIYHQFRKDP